MALDLYGRYALSYYILSTETAEVAIKAFERAFKVEPKVHPMIHTDRGATYCSVNFNDYLASKNCVHSMSHPGHPRTMAELDKLVQGAIEYFNTKRAYTTRNGLTAEQFRNQAA